LNGRAYHVGQAALEALYAARGKPPFDAVTIEEYFTDADIDPWSTDPAGWGASAYAGGTWDPESDSGKRREFWSWWLEEGMLTAWNLEH
jgi:hypothetical protein